MARRRRKPVPSQPQRRSARVRKRTRRSRFTKLLHRVLCLSLIIGAGVLTVTVFFKVDTVEVEGDTRYAAEALRQTLGVHKEDNLFFWSRRKAVERLLSQYPYLDEVNIKRRLPDKLVLSVTESTACAAIHIDEAYYLINHDGKILEKISAGGLGEIPIVSGVSPGETKVGKTLDISEDPNAQLLELLSAMDDAGMMQKIDFINMDVLSDIRVGYLGRFDVRFGTVLNLQRKIQFLQTVINERLSPSDIGIIDLTDETCARFQPTTQDAITASSGAAEQEHAVGQPNQAEESPQKATEPESFAEG